jgi:hypothetical protein
MQVLSQNLVPRSKTGTTFSGHPLSGVTIAKNTFTLISDLKIVQQAVKLGNLKILKTPKMKTPKYSKLPKTRVGLYRRYSALLWSLQVLVHAACVEVEHIHEICVYAKLIDQSSPGLSSSLFIDAPFLFMRTHTYKPCAFWLHFGLFSYRRWLLLMR